MPKALFQITDTTTKKPVPGLLFDNKQTAKVKRKELNKDENYYRFVVSPGPDHHKYQG